MSIFKSNIKLWKPKNCICPLFKLHVPWIEFPWSVILLLHFYLFFFYWFSSIYAFFFCIKYLFQHTYLFKFKLLLYLLVLSILTFELKIKNPMWLDLASIGNLENSLLPSFFWHINFYMIHTSWYFFTSTKKE